MAHGENAQHANKNKEYSSKRLNGYPPKGKITKKFTHSKERNASKKIVREDSAGVAQG